MKHIKLWHVVRRHTIYPLTTARGVIEQCDCGHYWIEEIR